MGLRKSWVIFPVFLIFFNLLVMSTLIHFIRALTIFDSTIHCVLRKLSSVGVLLLDP
jgi:hypothetical protein